MSVLSFIRIQKLLVKYSEICRHGCWVTDVNCFRACFVVAIVATVAYSVDMNIEDSRNSNTLNKMSAQNVLVSLPVLQYPLLGK
jgi:hypothetical protein